MKAKFFFIPFILSIVLIIFLGFSYQGKKACPTNYAYVEWADKSFCVAQFEMKRGNRGQAESTALGMPWVEISHPEARAACQALGENYDLISNSQWTKIARQIASTPENWSTGKVYEGSLSIGHASGMPDHPLEVLPKDKTISWSLFKRSHLIGYNKIVWDFAGNVAEWVLETNENKKINSPQGYISLLDFNNEEYKSYSPLRSCNDKRFENNYCGFGYYWTHDVGKDAIGRSGFWKHTTSQMSGVFSLGIDVSRGEKLDILGFRCVLNVI